MAPVLQSVGDGAIRIAPLLAQHHGYRVDQHPHNAPLFRPLWSPLHGFLGVSEKVAGCWGFHTGHLKHQLDPEARSRLPACIERNLSWS